MASHGYLLPTRSAAFSSRDTMELTARSRSEVLDLAKRAESSGLDSVWAGDSIIAKPRPDPLATLAAIAGATDSIELATGIYLPLLRHPINVAHQSATVDLYSGGRLTMGIGAGWNRPSSIHEHEQLGVPFDRRGPMLNEALDVIRALWTGETVSYDGEFYQLSDVSIGMQPCSEPRIYLASAAYDREKGFPRHVRERFERHADGWFPSMELLYPDGASPSPDAFTEGLDIVRSAIDDPERDVDTVLYHDVIVADRKDEALAEARSYYNQYYTDADFTDADIEKKGAFGPPDRIAEHVAAFADAGVETFVTRFPSTNQYEQLNRYASIVG